MATVAHLSDLHFGRMNPRLAAALLRTLDVLAPDLVAVSGDLTQRARRAQFERARQFLDAIRFPVLVVPGNHDVPLFNLPVRLANPYGGYRRYIAADLEPVFENSELIAVGLNSARRVPFYGGGRLNEAQIARAAGRLHASRNGRLKIVVTHHPFDLPAAHRQRDLIGRSEVAMRSLTEAGVDVLLAGHLHVSHVGHAAERYEVAGHSALVVQAGTMSTRTRGELNTMNVLNLTTSEITLERYSWNDAGESFAVTWCKTFHRTDHGWF